MGIRGVYFPPKRERADEGFLPPPQSPIPIGWGIPGFVFSQWTKSCDIILGGVLDLVDAPDPWYLGMGGKISGMRGYFYSRRD